MCEKLVDYGMPDESYQKHKSQIFLNASIYERREQVEEQLGFRYGPNLSVSSYEKYHTIFQRMFNLQFFH